MARVTMLWFGGVNYATPGESDAETFRTLKDAKDAFWRRADFDPYYPCVEAPEAHIWYGKEVGDYPDLVLSLGPKGAVRCERA